MKILLHLKSSCQTVLVYTDYKSDRISQILRHLIHGYNLQPLLPLRVKNLFACQKLHVPEDERSNGSCMGPSVASSSKN